MAQASNTPGKGKNGDIFAPEFVTSGKMTVQGMVVNERNEPMQAVAVYESDQNGRLIGAGTTTDQKGQYRAVFNPGFISFRSLGYNIITRDIEPAYQVIQLDLAPFNLPPVNITPGQPVKPKKNFLPLILGLVGVYYLFSRK
jgi:hypothetical protein